MCLVCSFVKPSPRHATLSHNGQESGQPFDAPEGDQEGSAWRSRSEPGDPEGRRPFQGQGRSQGSGVVVRCFGGGFGKGAAAGGGDGGGAEGEGGGGRRGLAQLGSAPGFEPRWGAAIKVNMGKQMVVVSRVFAFFSRQSRVCFNVRLRFFLSSRMYLFGLIS